MADLPINPTVSSVIATPAPTSVPSSAIQPVSPIAVPQTQPVPSDLLSQANQDLATLQTNAQTEADLAKSGQGNAENAQQTSQNDYQSLVDQLSGKTSDQAALEAQQGLPQINTDLRDLQTLKKQQTAGYIQGVRNIAQKNVSQGERNTAEIESTRQHAVDSLLTESLISAKQNDQLTAQAQVDRALNLKYDPILAKIDAQKAILENNKYLLTRADLKAANAKTTALDLQTKKIEEEKQNAKALQDMIINATSQGAPIADVQRAAKAKTPMEAAQILGKYAGDFLKNELLKSQLETDKAQRSKIYSEIGTNGVSSKPLTEGQAKDLTYAKRGQESNDIINSLQDNIVKMSGFDFAKNKALEKNIFTSGSVSPEIRQIAQAEGNFATAVLRKESGAAISPTEFATVEKQYFPRPGDDPTTLAQKKQNRETYINTTKSGVPGYDARVATPFVSTGNQQADAWFKQSSGALQNVNAQTSTPNAMTAGYSDNQK